jgi:hypothetical protein
MPQFVELLEHSVVELFVVTCSRLGGEISMFSFLFVSVLWDHPYTRVQAGDCGTELKKLGSLDLTKCHLACFTTPGCLAYQCMGPTQPCDCTLKSDRCTAENPAANERLYIIYMLPGK